LERPLSEAAHVVLLHAGIADRRMWEPLIPKLPPDRQIISFDMRGFGEAEPPDHPFSHARDLVNLLDERRLERVALVGASYGGRVALQVASNWPERVRGLALLGSATIGHDWSAGFRDYDAAEEAAFESGDIDAAVELNVRTWVDAGRDASEVDPEIRSLVADMQRRIFELDNGVDADAEPLAIEPERITAPTVLAVGEFDLPDFHAIALDLAERIPNVVAHETVAGAAHLVALERPAETARLIAPVI
jgi:pimeloyl-ACP methyl ester carboxylesterase